jgi:toxin-antitoxin system PIN domain toxin
MKLLDANVLLYAYDADSSHHAACRPWLNATFNSDEVIALPWQTILAFVRISTNPRATTRPLQRLDACGIVNSWLQRPNVAVIDAGDRFWRIFQDQVADAQIAGPMLTDAALAALAMENGATLCSTDRDFRRFNGLKLLDPTRTGERISG